jgi:hypothetical protein
VKITSLVSLARMGWGPELVFLLAGEGTRSPARLMTKKSEMPCRPFARNRHRHARTMVWPNAAVS